MKSMTIHISPRELTIRNELHFEIQRRNRGEIFRDKRAYSRKIKHKNKWGW